MRARPLALICLAVVVPLGFALKLWRVGGAWGSPGSGGALRAYLNNSAAGVAYEVFWCLVAFLVWPRRGMIVRICVAVFFGTVALEFLQMWRPGPGSVMAWVRSTFLGKAVLGTTFSWLDIAHYAVGCVLGGVCLLAIARSDESARETRAD